MTESMVLVDGGWIRITGEAAEILEHSKEEYQRELEQLDAEYRQKRGLLWETRRKEVVQALDKAVKNETWLLVEGANRWPAESVERVIRGLEKAAKGAWPARQRF